MDLSLPYSYKHAPGLPHVPVVHDIAVHHPPSQTELGHFPRNPSPKLSSAISRRSVIGQLHKYLLLFLFCFAEFMDSFIASALYPAINVLEVDLQVIPAQITWVFAAYSATFAAFLLISGRVSDVYGASKCLRHEEMTDALIRELPEWSFVTGAFVIGAFSLGCGFVHDRIAMFILRALAGIGAALTVPSALSLIVEWFPNPSEQAQGIALFGGSGALGNGEESFISLVMAISYHYSAPSTGRCDRRNVRTMGELALDSLVHCYSGISHLLGFDCCCAGVRSS